MKVFITGITGFAGSHIAEHFLDVGDEVSGSSCNGTWRPNTPDRLIQQVSLSSWDIRLDCPSAFERSLREFAPDCIVHMAGLSIPADCGRVDPNEEAQMVNSSGTDAVLQLATKINPKMRFILASSCLVYSSIEPHSPKVDEDHPLGPVNGYAKTKLEAERVVKEATVAGKIDGVIARMFQHAGPRQSSRLMLSEWAQQFATTTNPVTVRSLQTSLDIIDVRDAAAAFRALATQGRTGSCYNIGSGNQHTGEVLFRLLNEAADGYRDCIETAPATYINPIADIGRLHRHTGWSPKISIEKTVGDILEFWKTAVTTEPTVAVEKKNVA